MKYSLYLILLLVILFVSCFPRVDLLEETKAQPEIVVSVKLEGWADFQGLNNHPEGVDFSFVEVYSSRVGVFSIDNRGDVDLQIRGIALSDESSQFILDASSMETELAPGGKTEFRICFMPTRVGSVSAEVVIESNDSDTPIYSFEVRGEGTKPLSGLSGPQILVSVGSAELSNGESWDFGQVEVNKSSILNLSIKNAGDVTLSIVNIMYSGDMEDFVCIEPQLPVLLGPGTGIDLTVEFKPLSIGTHTISLTYINNDPVNGHFSIMFEGEGKTNPLADIHVKLGANEVFPGSVGYDFGSREVGTSSSEVPFTVENAGTADLQINDISSSDVTQFPVACELCTLQPGESTTLSVSFNPSSEGLQLAQITIDNDDPDENPFIFTVQGNGVISGVPNITLWRSNDPVTNGSLGYDFGEIQVNSMSDPVTFTIKNDGTAGLKLNSSPSFTSGNMDQFVIDCNNLLSTIPPGGAESFSVKFTPTLKGTFEAVIGINTDDPDIPLFSFRVRGVGSIKAVPSMQVYQNGSLIANGSTFNFGEVKKGSKGTPVTFSIKNSGTEDLQIKSYKKLDGKPKDFVVEMDKIPFKVIPGSSRTFTITFNPSALGYTYTRLQITSNDVTYYIRLEGTGI